MVVPLLIAVGWLCVAGCGFIGAAIFVPKVAAQVHEKKMTKHYENKVITKEDLKPGDHIYVLIGSKIFGTASEMPDSGSPASANSAVNALFTDIYHHGIYLDNGEVSDFGSFNKLHPVIRSLADFLHSRDDCIIYRREYTNARAPDQTVRLARELCRTALIQVELNNIDDFKPYHFINNNCEHYATKMKTEKHWSGQVEMAGFWNCSWAHKRYECCNQERAPAKSASSRP